MDLYSEKLDINAYWNKELQNLLIEGAVVNGTAMLIPEEKGSKTEIAMLKFF